MDVPLVSVIVPVLNDTAALERLLGWLRPDPRVQPIIVDASSAGDDDLVRLRASRPDLTWLTAPRGRALQMNAGAAHATGRWLLFLHADTRLGDGWQDELARAASDEAVVGGSFRFALASPARWARLIERGVALRVWLFGLPYGDQALFVRRSVFRDLRGYREMPLMEDVELVRRLRRRGRLADISVAAVTSARRWERDGWIRRSVENTALTLLYFAGCRPEWLARVYHRGSPK
jgi:rSAM/selenodomain-associated transferase 2